MANKVAKNTLESQRKFYAAIFGEECCPIQTNFNINDIEDAIAECEAMLCEAIHRSDKDEISYWRKLLQENKVQRRELLST